MQEKAFFIGFILFVLWIAGAAFVIYLWARLAQIEGGSFWRALVASLTSGFLLLVTVSIARGSIGANLSLWLAFYAVIALPVIKRVLRTTLAKAVVPWLGAALFLGVALLVWHLFPGILTVG
ncbi:MAG: hypothetical protein JW765_08525 [Deltaproteobacteria bacterium]|nr:hypothetical protein [Candidatus Zymogenaceae bacterium]